jgi:UDP-N-acetylglucosamine 4,6-dehydratase
VIYKTYHKINIISIILFQAKYETKGIKTLDMDGKVVLITGGTGSFGQKFVEKMLQADVKKVIVFSRDELKQYEMSQVYKDSRISFFIGDARNLSSLNRAFEGVDIVIHAAVMKHVIACEYNPFEAVRTNITGSQNVIEAALNQGVKRVIALSSDKAVNPVNLYGATKLASDKLFVAANSYSGTKDTRFAVVRYGNVAGSRDSVIPFFHNLKMTGRLPVTDERMTGFWITLDQGVQFVSDSLIRMKGGEIFVPKIPTVQIVDLAHSIAPECEIDYVGIRPGEKLHEFMITEDDARRTVEFDTYYVIQPEFPWWLEGGETYGGTPVNEHFCYASHTNPQWLSNEEIQEYLGAYR